MKKEFYEALSERRSYYAISKKSPVSDDVIQEVVEKALKLAPSAFNSQSARAVVLFGDQHDKAWEITRESLRKIVPADQFAPTNEKIDSFKNGYGTVLFFEEQSIIEGLQAQFALYKDNFPVWAQQAAGMAQLVVWAGLRSEGLGASLQHYNELIEAEIKSTFDLPDSWKLLAQMPFGTPLAEPGPKEYAPISERVRVFK